jgi:hypothetical protein
MKTNESSYVESVPTGGGYTPHVHVMRERFSFVLEGLRNVLPFSPASHFPNHDRSSSIGMKSPSSPIPSNQEICLTNRDARHPEVMNASVPRVLTSNPVRSSSRSRVCTIGERNSGTQLLHHRLRNGPPIPPTSTRGFPSCHPFTFKLRLSPR